MTDRTERLVHDQPRKVRRPLKRLPKRGTLRGILLAPAMVFAGAFFLIGAGLAMIGIGIAYISEPVLLWLYGGGE